MPATATRTSELDISTELAEGEAVVAGDAGEAARRGPRRGRTVLALAFGLLVGVAVAVLVPRLLDGDGDGDTGAVVPAEQRRTLDGDEEITSPEDLLPDDVEVPPGAGAESAEAALTGFLDAEVAKEFETSFGFLSSADRATIGSPDGWVAGHADVLPPILGYEIGEISEGGGDGVTTIATTMRFEPGLDQVVGLTPGRARVVWEVLEAEDGSWGVALDTSVIEALHPAEEGAVEAARRWVDARQTCETPANERSGLIGTPSLADQLCDVDGSFSFGGPEPLDQATATPFFTAFGSEATSALRVVRISGPVELGAVLAPIGDEWTVIGVVP